MQTQEGQISTTVSGCEMGKTIVLNKGPFLRLPWNRDTLLLKGLGFITFVNLINCSLSSFFHYTKDMFKTETISEYKLKTKKSLL